MSVSKADFQPLIDWCSKAPGFLSHVAGASLFRNKPENRAISYEGTLTYVPSRYPNSHSRPAHFWGTLRNGSSSELVSVAISISDAPYLGLQFIGGTHNGAMFEVDLNVVSASQTDISLSVDGFQKEEVSLFLWNSYLHVNPTALNPFIR